MRAVQLTAFGNPVDGLEYVDIPEPDAPGPNQVLIGVEFSPINPNDLMVAQGIYAYRPPLPTVNERAAGRERRCEHARRRAADAIKRQAPPPEFDTRLHRENEERAWEIRIDRQRQQRLERDAANPPTKQRNKQRGRPSKQQRIPETV